MKSTDVICAPWKNDQAWKLSRSLVRSSDEKVFIPPWNAYNSVQMPREEKANI